MTDYSAHSPVRRLSSVSEAQLGELAELLIDCVSGGASVGFMSPLSQAKALAFWRRVADGVAQGARALLVAEDAGGIVGTVQLILDQPENQPHRADVAKMLVMRRARRRGLGTALMRAAEEVAHACGKSLLVLDTASGDAAQIYATLGWQRCGVIPGYALLPHGGRCDTTVFYRLLPDDAGPRIAPAIAPLSVLIVDDNQDAADSLALLLEISGYALSVAHSGGQGLELARAIRPQVVILDIGLPDMDGYEVARLIRREPWGSKSLLVAMTGRGQAQDKERARTAGFDQHLTKPVDPQVIEALLRDCSAAHAQDGRS